MSVGCRVLLDEGFRSSVLRECGWHLAIGRNVSPDMTGAVVSVSSVVSCTLRGRSEVCQVSCSS